MRCPKCGSRKLSAIDAKLYDGTGYSKPVKCKGCGNMFMMKVVKDDFKPRYDRKHYREKVMQKLDGVVIGHYESMTEASKATGISISNISKAVAGKRKTAGGYEWEHDRAGKTTINATDNE